MALVKQYASRMSLRMEETPEEITERKKTAEWLALQMEALRLQDEYFHEMINLEKAPVYGREKEKQEQERTNEGKELANRLQKLAESCVYAKEEAKIYIDALYNDTILRQTMYHTINETENERALAREYLCRIVSDLEGSHDKPAYIEASQQGILDAAALIHPGDTKLQFGLVSGINRDLYYCMLLDTIEYSPEDAEKLLQEKSMSAFSREFMEGEKLFSPEVIKDLKAALEKKQYNLNLAAYVQEYAALLAPGGEESPAMPLEEIKEIIKKEVQPEYRANVDKRITSIYRQYEAAKNDKQRREASELCMRLITGITSGELGEEELDIESGFSRLSKKQQSVLKYIASPAGKPKVKPHSKEAAVYRADLWDALAKGEIQNLADLLEFEAGSLSFGGEPFSSQWAVEALEKTGEAQDYFLKAVSEATIGAPDRKKQAVKYCTMLYAIEAKLDLFDKGCENDLRAFAKTAAEQTGKWIA